MSIFLVLRVLYDTVLGVSCLVAFRWGGRDERTGAAIILIGTIFSLLAQQPPFFDWRFQRSGLFAVDVVVLIAYLWLALRSDRFWPLWATAFHLIAVATHLVVLVEPKRVLQAYAIAQGFWAYPILLAILIGTLGHRRRLRRQQRASRNTSP